MNVDVSVFNLVTVLGSSVLTELWILIFDTLSCVSVSGEGVGRESK